MAITKRLAIILSIVVCCWPTINASVTIDGFQYDLDQSDLTASVKRGKITNEPIVIPSTIEYNDTLYTVTSILDNAFYHISSPSVVIPNTVISIGKGAFKECASLTTVVIPNSVVIIGDNAFSFCTRLNSIEIPNTVITIGNDAFLNCSNLKSAIIGNSVKTIGDRAFWQSGLNTIKIPDSVSTFGEETFKGCENLTGVTIGNSVKSIGYRAFYECINLTRVTIGDSVTSIGNSAFNRCIGLGHIDIPNTVTSIGNYAFADCISLRSIDIPNSVTSIGDYAFSKCESLRTVYIPNSIETFGYSVFESFKPMENLESINYNTTSPVPAYLGVEESQLQITVLNVAVGGYKNAKSTEDWKAFKTIREIDFNELEHPTPVKIGQLYYYLCPEDKTAKVTNKYGSGGYLYSFESIEIPSEIIYDEVNYSVTSIADSAFYRCESLRMVIIPNSVTSIGDYAFTNCSNLTTIEFPNSVTTIGDHAFGGCYNLTAIEIPNSVTSIGDYAFNSCSSLKTIEIPNSVISMGTGAFTFCTSLSSIKIGDSITTIDRYTFEGCSSLASVEFGNSVKSIGFMAFCGCTSLTTINLPESLRSIGDRAFKECRSLISVDLGNSLMGIGFEAFASCSNLTTIEIPNSVTSIGNYAFEYCRSLSRIDYKTTVPISAERNIFSSSTYEQATLNVANGGIENAKSTEPWMYFADIQERDFVIVNPIPSTDTKIVWNQEFRCKVGDRIELVAEGENGEEVAFRFVGPYSGYVVNVPISCVDGRWYADFNQEGAWIIEAYLVGNPKVAVQRTHNTLSTDDGLLLIDGIYYRYTDETHSGLKVVRGYDLYVGDVEIPAYVNGLKVLGIDHYAFYTCRELGVVRINEGVESIGEESFANGSLSEIHIPASLTEITRFAFNSLTGNLKSIYLYADDPVKIDETTFNGCADYDNCCIYVPYNSTSNYREADIWKNFKNIREMDFQEQGLPTPVKIGQLYYYLNPEDKTAKVTNKYGSGSSSYSFESIEIPSQIIYDEVNYSVTSIAVCAFFGCENLQSVVIPNSVTSIGDYAFYRCEILSTIEIPNSVTSIGNYAFECCEYLYKIDYKTTAPITAAKNVFSSYAYEQATLNVGLGGLENAQSTEPWMYFADIQERDFVIDDTTPSIDTKIVWNQEFRCKVGDRVELVAEGENGEEVAFRFVRPDGGYVIDVPISCVDGRWYADFNQEGAWIIEAYLVGNPKVAVQQTHNTLSTDDDLLLIDGIYYRYADDNCSKLKVVRGYDLYAGDVEIPAYANGLKVVGIDHYAFYSCKELGVVRIKEGVESIGEQSFANGSLSEIHIPASLTKITRFAFNSLTGNLKSIYLYADDPVKIDETTFNGCADYDNCCIYVPYNTTSNYREADIWKNFKNIHEFYAAASIDDIFEDENNGTLKIYNINGICVSTSMDNLSPGFYIIRQGNKVGKIVVK